MVTRKSVRVVNGDSAQNILLSAHNFNRQVPKPIAGVAYTRITEHLETQASRCLSYVRQYCKDGTQLLIRINGLAESLQFETVKYKTFERSFAELGRYLGFSSQQPETEAGVGPDVLWSIGKLQYLVIECKNESKVDMISKEYINQLAGSTNWFKSSYDHTCSALPVMIHPSRTHGPEATPPAQMRIVNEESLPRLVAAIRSLAQRMAAKDGFGSLSFVADTLLDLKLTSDLLLKHYSVLPVKKK